MPFRYYKRSGRKCKRLIEMRIVKKLNSMRYLVILVQCLVSILSRGLFVIKTFEDLLHVSLTKKIADDNRKRKEIRNKL